MKRFTYIKEDGSVLRLVLTKEQMKAEEVKKALENWKKRWTLISEGYDTTLRQNPNGQIIFSDDRLLLNGNEWEIREIGGIWFCSFQGEDKLLQENLDKGYIIEP
jgi:hypothetical protein